MWWEILELTEDADQKAIKVAYAKKLKQTRPEDDPEGFKALHAAYQQALAWHAYKDRYADEDEAWEQDNEPIPEAVPVTDNAPPQSVTPFPELLLSFSARQTNGQAVPPLQTSYLSAPQTVIQQEPIPFTLQAPEHDRELIALVDEPLKIAILSANPSLNPKTTGVELEESTVEDKQFEVDWLNFQQQFSVNIHNAAYRKDPKAWHFLEELPSFMDLEFRERLSHELFGFISAANLKAAEHKSLFIKPAVLQYLNQLFAWDQQWCYLTELFGEQQTDAILLHTETPNALSKSTVRIQPEALHYYARFMAFIIDLLTLVILVFIPSLILTELNTPIQSDQLFFLGFYAWLLAYPLVEATPWQGSLGKRLMKLRVVNKKGKTLSLPHAYLRHFTSTVCILGFKIVVWINLILAYKRNMLLQDWVTQSYVIKRE